MSEEICFFCNENVITKLCDFPTGVVWMSTDCQNHTTTCDMPMCDECSTNISNEVDFCPACMEKYRNEFINWHRKFHEKEKAYREKQALKKEKIKQRKLRNKQD